MPFSFNPLSGAFEQKSTYSSADSSITATVSGNNVDLVTAIGGGGLTGIGALDGQTVTATGGAFASSHLYLQSADATHPGLVNNTSQIFSGAKQFNSTVSVGGALDASSALSVTSTTKGFLLPKLTWTQKKAITSPATGLAVYDTSSLARSYKSQGGEYVSGAATTTFSPWFDDSVLQVTTQLYGIACVADVSGSLNSKYFLLYNNTGTTYYVWFSVNGAGVDPAVAGATGLRVNIATNATAPTVGNGILGAICGSDPSVFQYFDPTGATSVANSVHGPGFIVFAQNSYGSSAPPPVDGAAPTGFTFYNSWTVYNNDWVINSNGDVMIVTGNGVFNARFGSNGGLTMFGVNGASITPGNNSPGVTSQIADILWNSDGGGSIGASGANRPDKVYAKTGLYVGTKSIFDGPTFTNTVTLPTTTVVGNYVLAPTEYNAGNSSTALTVNLANGSAQKITLTGACTFTFSNPQAGGAYVLRLIQDATGSRAVSWPSGTKWPGGTVPTLSTTAGAIDLINLYYDGTTYYGTAAIGMA